MTSAESDGLVGAEEGDRERGLRVPRLPELGIETDEVGWAAVTVSGLSDSDVELVSVPVSVLLAVLPVFGVVATVEVEVL